ncbi:MAG TPA: histidine kinase, partial [Spirochaetia bacterium]|nr:histidine kinase [Spirochaetia bacterium]
MKRRRWMFSNRLMLINALVLIAVLYVFAALAAVSLSRLELSRQLQQRREVLAALFDAYDGKHDEFFSIIFPLYDEKENYDTLSELLERPSDDALMADPFFKQRVTVMMRGLAIRDPDIVAILLYKNATRGRYVYDIRYQNFEAVSPTYPFFPQLSAKPAGRVVYGARELGSGRDARSVYGIAGTLGTRALRMDAGNIMVAYDAAPFTRILQRNQGSEADRYLILASGGEAVFDSRGAHPGQSSVYRELLDVGLGNRPRVIDGTPYYVQTVRDPGRTSVGVLLVPRSVVRSAAVGISVTIFAICTAVAALSAGLYLLAGLLVSRRVAEVERAMDRIGSHNLGYRIPLRGRDDEFEHISQRFNRMCDELQRNIDRLYVYQLNQKSAELSALQARINPHFLYNTLEAIRATFEEEGSGEAGEMIVLLADMFRGITRADPIVTLRDELNTCRTYLDLMTRRFSDGLQVEFAVEEQILELGTVRNLLQPVVENCLL